MGSGRHKNVNCRGIHALRPLALFLPILGLTACASIRVTDPPQTADQLYLESEATRLAVSKVALDQLRDRKVFIDTTYLTIVKENSEALSFKEVPQNFLFLVAELRSRLLLAGALVVEHRENADVIVEPRTGGVGVNRQEFLIGLASITIPTEVVASIPFTTPTIAIFQSTKQFGFSSVAIVAYWRNTGEVMAASGPFVGRTARQDYWICGFGPNTVGNIPPTEKPVPEASAK